MSGKSTFKIGIKAMLSLAKEGDAIKWYEAKLEEALFKGTEVGLFKTFEKHLAKYHKLPAMETLFDNFPDLKEIPIVEEPVYYLDLLEERYKYDVINDANVKSQTILAEDKTKVEEAHACLFEASKLIQARTLGKRVITFTQDAPKILLNDYHESNLNKAIMKFHWDYLDWRTKGAGGGDMISIVGRPQAGKSWVLFYNAYANFAITGKSSLVVSMEMNHLAVSQRLSVLNSKTNITQLKTKQYATGNYQRFKDSLQKLQHTDGMEIYIVDGNLAADIEDIYLLAQQLQVDGVYIDGAYLCRTKNDRLARYDRVTTVAESIKSFTSQLDVPSFSTWQFNRDAVKGKNGKKEEKTQQATLEDIGMTDAVGQLSSVVLGLMQERSVETLNSRTIDVLKGRDGETGKFRINWDFINMDFTEIDEAAQKQALQFI